MPHPAAVSIFAKKILWSTLLTSQFHKLNLSNKNSNFDKDILHKLLMNFLHNFCCKTSRQHHFLINQVCLHNNSKLIWIIDWNWKHTKIPCEIPWSFLIPSPRYLISFPCINLSLWPPPSHFFSRQENMSCGSTFEVIDSFISYSIQISIQHGVCSTRLSFPIFFLFFL